LVTGNSTTPSFNRKKKRKKMAKRGRQETSDHGDVRKYERVRESTSKTITAKKSLGGGGEVRKQFPWYQL